MSKQEKPPDGVIDVLKRIDSTLLKIQEFQNKLKEVLDKPPKK